eukprot:TRINITY_DN18829_c0_g1_i1.p1 TRINITY_DN18829_c0_g1~~TRINITY_DN18829_c0_g1_i1.p1  ORF type:complete len:144 (+),score=33.84 TRINITY_DN18829_c0_g1_i1:447-878(+)
MQVTIQRSLEDFLLDPKVTASEKKKGNRRSTITRQLSKKAQRRTSTSSVTALWGGKLAPHTGGGVTPSIPSQREKKTATLPPPKGPTRTLQEIEDILLQEIQHRVELEDSLQNEIAARQELDRKLTEFLITLKEASRLLNDKQ